MATKDLEITSLTDEKVNPAEPNIAITDIVGEMQKSFMDYAMSVIVSRALPSAEDGLKPVHRRILYAMKLMGLEKGMTKKCAGMTLFFLF